MPLEVMASPDAVCTTKLCSELKNNFQSIL